MGIDFFGGIKMITVRMNRKKKIYDIEIEKIVLGKFNLRHHYNEEKIDHLANSIKVFGMLQPVILRKFNKKFELISGERRILAAKKAGLIKVPALIIDARFDAAAAIAIAENSQREELYHMDSADAFMTFMRRRGLTYAEMAEIVGTTQKEIIEEVRLLQMPKSIREVIVKGNLSKEYINAVDVLEDEKERVGLLQKAVEENISPDKLSELAKSVLEEKKVRKQVVKDAKIFVNTINQAVDMITKSGMYASSERSENNQYIEYVIKIEK